MPTAYWRDEYNALPASIAGVPFHVDKVDSTVGRRDVIQRFPGTNATRLQELSEEADTFTISGYLIGRDYHVQKRALEAEFRRPGAKLLVHPYRGRLMVLIDGPLTTADEIARGGQCTVSFRCVLFRDASTEGAVSSPVDVVRSAATVARETAQERLGDRMASLLADGIASALSGRLDTVQELLTDTVGSALSVSSEVSMVVVGSLSTMTDIAMGLTATPSSLLGHVAKVTRSVVNAPFVVESAALGEFETMTNGQRVAAMIGVGHRLASQDTGLVELAPACLDDGAPAPVTPTQVDILNAQCVTSIVRCEAALAIAEAMSRMLPESRAQAAEVLAVVDRLLMGVDGTDPDAVLRAVDPLTFEALTAARAALYSLLMDASLRLPGVRVYIVTSDTSGPLLAQLLFGDSTRWLELYERNDIGNPLFIPAGTSIEYLER